MTAPITQVEAVAKALRVFLAPSQVTEIRALFGGKKIRCMVSGHIDRLAQQAAEWDQAGAVGVYFTPNPVRPDLEGSRASARADDIVERRWLLIDVDPIREAGIASTEDERRWAWDVLCRVRGEMDGRGLTGAVVGDSGNGWHLCYPIRLPNDGASKEMVKSILAGLHKRCSTDRAKVDTSTYDAPRIWKLYGTHARKGRANAERPHRLARIVEAAQL